MSKLPKLPPRGTKVADLKCPKCQKTMAECAPKDCTDEGCPQKPKD